MRKNKLIVSAMFLTMSSVVSATEVESKVAEPFCIFGFCFGDNQEGSDQSRGGGDGVRPPSGKSESNTVSLGGGDGVRPPKN